MRLFSNFENQSNSVSFSRPIICKILIIALILSNFLGLLPLFQPVWAQDVPIVVTADQPNVWTLEQAHYLLAQMHRRNLDLKAKRLEDLDANAINGVNIDILRTLLEVGVNFSQADLFNNQQARSNTVFNNTRRQALIKQNDDLRINSLQLTEDISILNSKLKQAESEEEKADINAEIEQKTAQQKSVDKQIELNNSELKTLNPADSKVKDTTSSASFNKDKQDGILEKSFADAAKKIIEKADTPPQLNATLQLDNFLQLQYEIISKQLTLLRDEVGSGERLLFLELPQSINASYDKANNKWAQSWWRVRGYTKSVCKDSTGSLITCPPSSRGRNLRPKTISDFYRSITATPTPTAVTPPTATPTPTPTSGELYGQYKLERSDIKSVDLLLNKFKFSERSKKSTDILYELLPEKTKTFLEKDVSFLSEENKKLNDCLDAQKDNSTKKSPCPTPTPAPSSQGEKLTALLNGLNWIIESSPLYELNDNLASKDRVPPISDEGEEIDSGKILKFNRQVVEKILGNELINAEKEIFEKTEYIGLDSKCLNAEVFKSTPCNQNQNANSQDDKSQSTNNSDWLTAFNNRQVRTVELIPRQSSLNVNDIKLRNKVGVFNVVGSFLFGLGANVNYQRQREQFSQFVQQELYSSAFGKGSTEFGWTFTPMPGTDRIASGVRTTYAVVIVPKEATSVMVESTGCYFNRSERQPENFDKTDQFGSHSNKGCGNKKTFVLPIPGGGDDANMDFYVSGVTYQPVKKGKRIVVSIYGDNFSSQIGVLVNGTPLKQSVGLAQPFILDDSEARKTVDKDLSGEEIKGNFERIDSNQIIATFTVPDEGTPIITLVAPGVAIDINRLNNLYINGNRYTSLGRSDFMFGTKPSTAAPLKIDNVEVFPIAGVPNQINAAVYGVGINQCQSLIMNGAIIATPPMPEIPFPPKLLTITNLPVNLADEYLKFTLNCNGGSDIIKSPSVKNPFYIPSSRPVNSPPVYNPTYLRIDKVTFISYEESTLVVELEGSGFTDTLQPNNGEIVVQSATKAVYQLKNPSASQIITFTDNNAGFLVKKVITRSPYPKELSTETKTKTKNN